MKGDKGRVIILSGPSGVGKGTIVKKLLERNPGLRLSVSATTRAPREGEENGREYYFITKEDFERRIAAGEMLEYAEYVGNYYGTPADAVRRQTDAGLGVILEIEIRGAKQIFERVPDAVSLFILPPDRETLISRLRGRGTESEEVILRRTEKALEELQSAGLYSYAVVNDDLDTAVSEVEGILRREKACADFR